MMINEHPSPSSLRRPPPVLSVGGVSLLLLSFVSLRCCQHTRALLWFGSAGIRSGGCIFVIAADGW